MLKYKLTAEEYEALEDEAVQGLYEEQEDGAYQLGVEGIDDGAELKEALRKEREDRKAARKRATELEAEREKAEKEAREQQGQFKELYEKTQADLDAEKKRVVELHQTMKLKEVEAVAGAIAATLTKDTRRAGLLKEKAQQYLKYDADTSQVVIEIGGIPVDREKLVEKLSSEYDFLVDGKDASGGGASGGAGSQGGFKPLKEYTEEEVRTLYKTNPAFQDHINKMQGG